MIILITGASDTGKTLLAQKMLEKYKYPYLSIDHLKMGLIRSGNTVLTPKDDDDLTEYLWPIVREIIKTAIENRQNLIVEGCYLPFTWRQDFDERYLSSIRFICLAMSEKYIENHFHEIIAHASEIESRLSDADCTMDSLKTDNKKVIKGFQRVAEQVVLIDSCYEQTIKALLVCEDIGGFNGKNRGDKRPLQELFNKRYDLWIGDRKRNTMKQYIIDAFTDKPFSGNPAAVCVMESWPSEEFMMKLAMENNLSETAFIVKEERGYHLRWFTPGTEVELCGHATLASSYVIFTFCEPESSEVRFHTLSGTLTVRKKGDLYEMDFPTYPLREIPVTEEMEQAFGIRPVKAVLGLDLICVFENEEQVRSIKPDQAWLTNLEGRIQNATAKGTETDCVSRSFCPKLSIAEDPVCGSAHCQIADYWSGELNKKEILAYQASKRGGYLYCVLREDGRINISGKAALVAIADIVAEL